MATKNPKEATRKVDLPLQKSKEIEERLPGQLEKEFRRSLGRHNLHFNMLEVSVQTFAETLSKQSSEAVYIRDRAKKMGFHSLYPDASFASARSYLMYSHIAYVFSAGDMLCERIRSARSMKLLKGNTAFFNEIDKGDFVRKTLALTVLATLSPECRNADAVNAKVEKIQTTESFALVNYFRIIRNEELHAAGESGRRVAAARDALPEALINARYGAMPALAGQLDARDALLCSKAWQGVAECLCRNMLNDTDAKSILKNRFGRLKVERREAAARKFMELELLYSQDDINTALSVLGW